MNQKKKLGMDQCASDAKGNFFLEVELYFIYRNIW